MFQIGKLTGTWIFSNLFKEQGLTTLIGLTLFVRRKVCVEL